MKAADTCWRAAASVLCLLAVIFVVGAAPANEREEIPFEKLSEEHRTMILGVTREPTFDLRIGPRELQGRKAIFDYLIDHLELCAIAGRALGIDDYHTRRESDGRIFGDDGQGATGYLTFVHVADGKRVFYVEGLQKGLFTVGGHSVLALDFNELGGETDRMEYKLRAWIRVDSAFFAFFSRVFLNQSKATADRQFTRLLGIPVGVTQKSFDDAGAVLAALDGLDEADRDQLKELRKLVEGIAKK